MWRVCVLNDGVSVFADLFGGDGCKVMSRIIFKSILGRATLLYHEGLNVDG